LLAHGWWFSLGTPASSITKTGRHDIAEIFLKVALNTKKLIYQSNDINTFAYNLEEVNIFYRPLYVCLDSGQSQHIYYAAHLIISYIDI
jgi:hypothetical protein